MTDSKYLEKCKRTMNTKISDDIGLHCAIGLSTETNEILDAYKKARFYGRGLDKQNIKEEIGDVMWYLIQLCEQVDYSLEQAKIDNIKKLEKRYPNKFEDVLVRNQEQELNHISKD